MDAQLPRREKQAMMQNTFGDQYKRLVAQKIQYDSITLFRLHQNI
jgi:hypothetical protein